VALIRLFCRPSKISDSYKKLHINRILEDKIFGASQMCDTIAINAKLPRARLIINRATVRINAAREKFQGQLRRLHREQGWCVLPAATGNSK
jgi:hypothetical protein